MTEEQIPVPGVQEVPLAPQDESASTETPEVPKTPETPVVTGADQSAPSPAPGAISPLAMSLLVGRTIDGKLVVNANGFHSGYEIIGFIVNELDQNSLVTQIQEQMRQSRPVGPPTPRA